MPSTRIDNFIRVYSLSAALDPWYITDGWVVQGGKYINIEFSRDGAISSDDWTILQAQIEFISSSGDFFGTVLDVHHEIRDISGEQYSVVILKILANRYIARSETIQIKRGSSPLCTNGDESIVYFPTTPTEVTLRNFSNVDASGDAAYTLRVGNNQNNLKSTNNTIAAESNFVISSGSLSGANLVGSHMTISTQRGSISQNTTDSEFNNKKTWSMSDSYIGKMLYDGTRFVSPDISDNSWSWIFTLKVGSTGTFYVSKVAETVMGGGRTEYDGPVKVQLPATKFSLVNQDTTVEYAFTNIIKVDSASKTMTLNFGLPETIYLGDIANRTCVIMLRYDGTSMYVNMMNGNQVKRLSSYNANFPSLGANDYYAIRSTGITKIQEFQEFNYFVSDIKAQEYCSYIDYNIQTSARNIYVDLDAGNANNTGLSSGSPLLTIASAIGKVMVAAGDHVLIKSGTSTSLTSPVELMNTTSFGSPALGYSADYPFVLGYYDTRSNGRPDIDFSGNVASFIDINGLNDNIAIHGLYLHSTERDYTHGSFVGLSTMDDYTNGYGIIYDVTHLNDNLPISLVVDDCRVGNVLRSGICVRDGNVTLQKISTKYSAILKSQITDHYNANYSKENQNHEISSLNYGVSGVYAESVTGLCVDNVLFYRVGWLPDTVDIVSNIHSGIYHLSTNRIVTNALIPYVSSYRSWSSSNSSVLDFQRLSITEVEGISVAINSVCVSGDIAVSGSSVGLPVKNATGILSDGDDVDFSIIDAFPRCAGNSDIVIMGKRIASGQNGNVRRTVQGPIIISSCVSVESSGYQVLADTSYLSYQCVSVDSPYGSHISQDYTRINRGYYGSSYGTDIIRKTSNGISENLFIGDLELFDKSIQHGWSIKSPANKTIQKAIISENIFAFTGASGMDGIGIYNDDVVSGAVYFDINSNKPMNVLIRKNTFYNSPLSCINMYAASISGIEFKIQRNIFDQKLDDAPNLDLFYSFIDPYTTVTGSWGALFFGGVPDRNIYNQEDLAASPETQDRVRVISALDLTFNQWQSGAPDNGDWKDIQYATEGRSLNTYNADILSGPESSIHFATTAISSLNDGWDSMYSAYNILSYIRAGFTPMNLDPALYNDDFVGAVPFDYAASTSGGSFGAQKTENSSNHGYGKGF